MRNKAYSNEPVPLGSCWDILLIWLRIGSQKSENLYFTITGSKTKRLAVYIFHPIAIEVFGAFNLSVLDFHMK